MASPSDAVQWLPLALAGSQEALGRVLEDCRGYLLVIAERELDPDLRAKGGASDLVQETFLEAQRDFAQFHGTTKEELLAWLRHLLLNNLATFSRRYRETAKRRVSAEIALTTDGPQPAVESASPLDEAIAREQAEALRGAVERLPEDYRRVLLWRYQHGLSFEEIGRMLNRSANAARKTWVRAIERLQQDVHG